MPEQKKETKWEVNPALAIASLLLAAGLGSFFTIIYLERK